MSHLAASNSVILRPCFQPNTVSIYTCGCFISPVLWLIHPQEGAFRWDFSFYISEGTARRGMCFSMVNQTINHPQMVGFLLGGPPRLGPGEPCTSNQLASIPSSRPCVEVRNQIVGRSLQTRDHPARRPASKIESLVPWVLISTAFHSLASGLHIDSTTFR